MKDLVLIGHSLGAHTVGRAAKQITTGRIPVIIGLDPASVFFDFEKTDKRLADTDADYVQVIHTDSGHYSIEYPIGHADFYPNGGRKQPGCPLRNYFTNLVGNRNDILCSDRLQKDFYKYFYIFRKMLSHSISCLLFGKFVYAIPESTVHVIRRDKAEQMHAQRYCCTDGWKYQ